MSKTEKQTDQEAALKLAAARLILGDELATRVIEDQWNAINDLADPYEVRDNSARYSMDAARLSVSVLGALCEALKAPLMDLGNRRIAAMGDISEDERKAWSEGDAPVPEIYAAETARPFQGDPREIMRALLAKPSSEGEFELGDPVVTVICKARPDGSAWISVGNATEGPHFQCDYHGSLTEGPKHSSDFACDPPQWVIERLGLDAG